MKTLSNHPSKVNKQFNPSPNFQSAYNGVFPASSFDFGKQGGGLPQKSTDLVKGHKDLLTPKALYQMSLGMLPDLWATCHELYSTFFDKNASNTAMQFVPILRDMITIKNMEIERFIKHPESNHVLIQNDLLKVVLIHWQPGKCSDIHGHPAGGCVFKVLHGSIEEKRYTSTANPELIAVSKYHKGSMAYIDDQMAYHVVGNPFDASAISLHVYTPGLKKS
jgi:predicted metal-dependent enzyme (double-stranded beta helix superfamily)